MEKRPQENVLEDLIQRELSKLPPRSAPETLIPRVLARIQAQQARHWWQRPWTQWPFGLQVASVPFMMATITGTLMALSMVCDAAAARIYALETAPEFGAAAVLWDVVSALANAVVVLARSPGLEWMWLAVLVPFAMYAACLGAGTLAYRMAVRCR